MKLKQLVVSAVVLLIGVFASQLIPDLSTAVEPDIPAAYESQVVFETSSGSSAVRQDNVQKHWGNPNTLDDHFRRHGGDFDAKDAEDYVLKSYELYENRDNYQIKTDSDGTVRIYDPETNSFGAYNKNGTARTFFKPSDGQDYFDRQPGS